MLHRRYCLEASTKVAVGILAALNFPKQAIAQNKAELEARLASALAKQDAVAIRAVVAEMHSFLGETAGVPEVADQFVTIPRNGRWLSADEAKLGFEPLLNRIERYR